MATRYAIRLRISPRHEWILLRWSGDGKIRLFESREEAELLLPALMLHYTGWESEIIEAPPDGLT
jgi:hypothetical protein